MSPEIRLALIDFEMAIERAISSAVFAGIDLDEISNRMTDIRVAAIERHERIAYSQKYSTTEES